MNEESKKLTEEFRGLVAELKESVVTDNKEAIDRINERMDKQEFDMKTMHKPRPEPSESKKELEKEFKHIALEFVSGNRHELKKREVKNYHPSIETKSDNLVRFDFASAGALLLPAQISDDIIKNVTETTPALALARVTTTDRSEYKRRVRTGLPGGNWLAENATGTKTKPTYAEVNIPPQKYGSRYAWTIEQQQDTGYNLVGELTEAFREDFGIDIGAAFLSGDGVGKPTGLIGNISNFDSAQLAISTNDLIRIQEELKEPYQANASWLFTRKTRAYIRTLVLSSTNGLQYTWEPNFQRTSPTLLLGAPVFIARDGQMAGRVEGDFTVGEVYAIYGDFSRGYEMVMHTDMYMIDDPYTEASSFVRNMHIMTRVGGNVIQAEALVQMTAAGA